MKIFLALLFLAISIVYIAKASVIIIIILISSQLLKLFSVKVPINQLIFNGIYCNNSLPLLECNIRVQRKNKTFQALVGNITVKSLFTNDISILMTISYQDYSGIWKGLIMRNVHKACDTLFTKGGMFYDQRKQNFIDSVDGCPSQPAFSRYGPTIVMRYRKDWTPDLKLLIPPYFLEADNWLCKLSFYYKDDPETAIGDITTEFRLINEKMSQ